MKPNAICQEKSTEGINFSQAEVGGEGREEQKEQGGSWAVWHRVALSPTVHFHCPPPESQDS